MNLLDLLTRAGESLRGGAISAASGAYRAGREFETSLVEFERAFNLYLESNDGPATAGMRGAFSKMKGQWATFRAKMESVGRAAMPRRR